MATLNPTLTLTSADTTSDALSVSVTDTLSIAEDVLLSKYQVGNVAGTSGVQINNTARKVSHFYVKNSSAVTVYLGSTNAAAAKWITLLPGEFAFFPWNNSVNLFAVGATGTGNAVEVMEFETSTAS